jgi:ribose transport system permease protein
MADEQEPSSALIVGETRELTPSAGTNTTVRDGSETGGPVAAQHTNRDRFASFLTRYGVLFAFAVTILVFSLVRPDTFPTVENLKAILTTAAPSLVVAVGLTVPLIMQDFDLSFGSAISMSGGAAVVVMSKNHAGWGEAVGLALILALGVGLINGFLISYLGGSSFIITLAMGTVITGVEIAITNQTTVFSGVSHKYTEISQSVWLGLSSQVWIAAVIALIMWVVLDRTELGRYMYAVGGNIEAARLSGIRTRALRLLGFVIIAVAAGIVGIMLTSSSGSYTPSFGASYLLPAYAGAFLGSAVLRPGQFSVPGTVIGVLFLGVIQTGLTLLNLQTFLINLIQGAILIFAILLSRLGQRTA